jgi:anti-sigma B factor antagonist
MLAIDSVQKGKVKLIHLKGVLNSAALPKAKTELTALLSPNGKTNWVIDLTEVEMMTSAGLRLLLLLQRQGAHFILTGLSTNLEDLLAVTGFIEIFEVNRTNEAALKKLNQASERRIWI